MDELELLKQNWNQDKDEFKNYSEKELFQMTKRKSVSIAKWLFLVGLMELLFWIGLDYYLSIYDGAGQEKSYPEVMEAFLDVFGFISGMVPFVFIGILFYLNYKIRVEEEPKKLMKNILLMRKSVKWYIRIFLFQIVLGVLVGLIFGITEDIEKGENYMITILGILIALFMVFIVILFVRFIYHLIYGNLLYKLEKNYKELSEIEENK